MELCASITFWVEITLPHGNEIISKKLFKRNKTCNYTLFHSGEKSSFLTKSFYFHLKGFLTSSPHRRCFKDLFHKSARAFLGLIGEARITLSKAITLIQSFLPQLSSWSACNCLISYLNASFTPMKTCESHLCWLTSHSARHKRTEGNFAIGVTMATVPARLMAAPACVTYSPTRAPPLPWLGKPAFPLGLLCSECFGLSSRRSEADQTHRICPLNRERAGNHHKVTLLLWFGWERDSGYFLCSNKKSEAQNAKIHTEWFTWQQPEFRLSA